MLITEKQFFEELINKKVPAMKKASELYKSGDRDSAVSTFVSYAKSIIDSDKYYNLRIAPKNLSDKNVLWSAERSVNNIFRSVGVDIDFGKDAEINWTANPTYNIYREWVYQFNRHQAWREIGIAYRLTGDEKYAQCFERLVRSWIETAEQCPENANGGHTLCWRTIECGIRMMSWAHAIHMCINSPSISDETWLLIFMSMWEHCTRMRKNGSYSGNWLIIEMEGMLSVCTLYGSIYADTDAWLDFALHTLEIELDN